MAELPTFITAYFGALIIGVGYLGLWFKYKIDNRNFYELKAFDKTMQSLMLGMISFLITLSFFETKSKIISNEQELINFLLAHQYIIIINLIVVFYVVIYLVIFTEIVKKYFDIDKFRKSLKKIRKEKIKN